jgi:hypothetical protein
MIVASLVLALAFSISPRLHWGVACMSPEGYKIAEGTELLDRDAFRQPGLVSHLQRTVVDSDADEFFVVASSDPALYEWLTRPPTSERWFERLSPSVRLAYFFKFGTDAFTQYSDGPKPASWAVLSGSNAFEEAFGKQPFIFVGFDSLTSTSVNCADNGRRLIFVVPDTTREKVLAVAKALDQKLAYPRILTIDFFTRIEDAIRMSTPQFPSLDLLPQFAAELQRRSSTDIPKTEKEFREYQQKTPMSGRYWCFGRMGPGTRWLSDSNGPDEKLAW